LEIPDSNSGGIEVCGGIDLKRELVTMHHIFRHLTLNRIGAGLFLIGLALLLGGLIGGLVSWGSQSSTSVSFSGLSGPQSLLLGLASLALSAIVFGLAIVNERLVRIEAKLDSLGKSSGSEDHPAE
jgi:hypothetical protein